MKRPRGRPRKHQTVYIKREEDWNDFRKDFALMIDNHKDKMTPAQFGFNCIFLSASVLLHEDPELIDKLKELAVEAIDIAYSMIQRSDIDKSTPDQPVNEELGHSESGSA